MNFSPRSLGVGKQFCEAITLETITRFVPLATIAAVIDETGVREQRARKLTAGLTVLGLNGMSLAQRSQMSVGAVLQKLVKGVRLLWRDWEYEVATAGAFS